MNYEFSTFIFPLSTFNFYGLDDLDTKRYFTRHDILHHEAAYLTDYINVY